jgi:hypothetical protein
MRTSHTIAVGVFVLAAAVAVAFLSPEGISALTSSNAASWVQAVGSIAGIAAGAAVIRWQVKSEARRELLREAAEAKLARLRGILSAATISVRIDAVQNRLMGIHPDLMEMQKHENSRKIGIAYYDSLIATLRNLPYFPSVAELEAIASLDEKLAQDLAITFAELKMLAAEIGGFAPGGGERVNFTGLFDGAMYMHLLKWKDKQFDIINSLSRLSGELHGLARQNIPENPVAERAT